MWEIDSGKNSYVMLSCHPTPCTEEICVCITVLRLRRVATYTEILLDGSQKLLVDRARWVAVMYHNWAQIIIKGSALSRTTYVGGPALGGMGLFHGRAPFSQCFSGNQTPNHALF